jgi:hypothetical protein
MCFFIGLNGHMYSSVYHEFELLNGGFNHTYKL